MLLIALIVAMGAGITAYAVGHAFAAGAVTSGTSQTQQTTSTNSGSAHIAPWHR